MGKKVKVATTDEVPANKGKMVVVNGTIIALFRVDGAYFAIDNDCCHQGGPLGEGWLEGNLVVCPWHGWKFDLATGDSPFNPNARQRTYPVTVEGNDLFLEI